jgi:IPTL-CTERM motif
MKIKWLIVMLTFLAFVTPAQSQVVVSDGDFTSWTFGTWGTSTATMVVEGASGNPGPRLNVTTVTTSRTWGTGYKTDYSTTNALEGLPITLQIDALAGLGDGGQGQYFMILVEQSGTLYAMWPNNTVNTVTGLPSNSSWGTLTFSGTLTAANFVKVTGAGPATPNLNGGVATRFGFAAGNQNSPSLTQYYDNFRVTLQNSAPVSTPTISEWGLMLLSLMLAAIGFGFLRRNNN